MNSFLLVVLNCLLHKKNCIPTSKYTLPLSLIQRDLSGKKMPSKDWDELQTLLIQSGSSVRIFCWMYGLWESKFYHLWRKCKENREPMGFMEVAVPESSDQTFWGGTYADPKRCSLSQVARGVWVFSLLVGCLFQVITNAVYSAVGWYVRYAQVILWFVQTDRP